MNLKFDLSQLNELDPKDVSRWPLPIKVIVILLLCAGVLFAGFWFDTRNQVDKLERVQKQEQKLKDEFRKKQHKAANLEDYKAQMVEMQASFGTMLRQLPSETEVAELLSDISQTGLSDGLEFELFKPRKEKPEDFYAVLPIQLKVVGSYHEFGNFVSDVAALPRIVTLHDFSIKMKGKNRDKGDLVMEATARTYRYLNEEEQ